MSAVAAQGGRGLLRGSPGTADPVLVQPAGSSGRPQQMRGRCESVTVAMRGEPGRCEPSGWPARFGLRRRSVLPADSELVRAPRRCAQSRSASCESAEWSSWARGVRLRRQSCPVACTAPGSEMRAGVAEQVKFGPRAGGGKDEPEGAATPTLKIGKCDQRLVTAIPGTEDRTATARESAGGTEQRNAEMPTPFTGVPRSQAIVEICTLKFGRCEQLLVTAIPGTEVRSAPGVPEQRNAGMPTPCTG